MKKILCTAFGLIIGISAMAQVPNVPYDFNPGEPQDYKKTEPQALDCMKWYLDVPMNRNADLYNYVFNFLLKWTSGNPGLNLSLDPGVAGPILEENAQPKGQYVIMAYLCGIALYKLTYPEQNDPAAIQLEGVRAALRFYENNRNDLGASNALKLYLDLNNSGQLDGWVKGKLTNQ